MRISDWSSDVCSSDLLNDEERAALSEVTRMGYPLRGWWNHEQLDSGYFMQIAPMVPMLDPNYVNEFWTTPRSEEHTSELQSLMRISYAVFCLKKKKYNKQLAPKRN